MRDSGECRDCVHFTPREEPGYGNCDLKPLNKWYQPTVVKSGRTCDKWVRVRPFYRINKRYNLNIKRGTLVSYRGEICKVISTCSDYELTLQILETRQKMYPCNARYCKIYEESES